MHLRWEKPSSTRRHQSEGRSLKAQSRLTRERRGSRNQFARGSRDETLLNAKDMTLSGTGMAGGRRVRALYDTSSDSKEAGRFSMRHILLWLKLRLVRFTKLRNPASMDVMFALCKFRVVKLCAKNVAP